MITALALVLLSQPVNPAYTFDTVIFAGGAA